MSITAARKAELIKTYSVKLLIRSDKRATCTSGEPVSPDLTAYVLISSALRAAVIDIVTNLCLCRHDQ